jgi:hypothetical protein
MMAITHQFTTAAGANRFAAAAAAGGVAAAGAVTLTSQIRTSVWTIAINFS